jgi:hypothetical protein
MGGLFSGPQIPQVAQAIAPVPTVAPPPVMPTPDDAAVREAKRKSALTLTARRASGRAGTIATQGDPVDTLA